MPGKATPSPSLPGFDSIPRHTIVTPANGRRAGKPFIGHRAVLTQDIQLGCDASVDVAASLVRVTDTFGFSLSELRQLRALKTPAGVQKFLDELPYNLSFTARSPKKSCTIEPRHVSRAEFSEQRLFVSSDSRR